MTIQDIQEKLISMGYKENPTRGTDFAPFVAHCMIKENKSYAKTFYLMENGQVIYEGWDLVKLKSSGHYGGVDCGLVEKYA